MGWPRLDSNWEGIFSDNGLWNTKSIFVQKNSNGSNLNLLLLIWKKRQRGKRNYLETRFFRRPRGRRQFRVCAARSWRRVVHGAGLKLTHVIKAGGSRRDERIWMAARFFQGVFDLLIFFLFVIEKWVRMDEFRAAMKRPENGEKI